MSLDPHTVMHRWFEEVWNQGREETVDELSAPGVIGHGLGESGAEVRGTDQFKVFLRNMRSAFPDVRIPIEDTVVQGDKAVVRVVLEGTHLGDGLGIPPTGRRVRVSGIIVARIVDGQIAESWNCWDQLGLLKQISAEPAVESTDRFLTARG